MKKALILLSFVLVAVVAYAGELTNLTADFLNMNGRAISGSPSTDAIPMDDGSRMQNQLTIDVVMTWGTSTDAIVSCTQSNTTTAADFKPVTHGVYDSTNDYYVMTPLRWFLESTAGTKFTLEIPNNKKYVKCAITGSGTGTAVFTGSKGRH